MYHVTSIFCEILLLSATFLEYSINNFVFCPPLQVLELLCNKAQPHRCPTGLMGSLSPRWRGPSLSGDRTGGDGQKWGASCHDNWWGLLIGQGAREQTKHFLHHRDENTCLNMHTPWAVRASWFHHMYCTASASSALLPGPWSATVATYPPQVFHMHRWFLTWFSLNPLKQCWICKMRNQFEGTEV